MYCIFLFAVFIISFLLCFTSYHFLSFCVLYATSATSIPSIFLYSTYTFIYHSPFLPCDFFLDCVSDFCTFQCVFSHYGEIPFIMLYIIFLTHRLGYVDSCHSSHPSKIMCSCLSYYLFVNWSTLCFFLVLSLDFPNLLHYQYFLLPAFVFLLPSCSVTCWMTFTACR